MPSATETGLSRGLTRESLEGALLGDCLSDLSTKGDERIEVVEGFGEGEGEA